MSMCPAFVSLVLCIYNKTGITNYQESSGYRHFDRFGIHTETCLKKLLHEETQSLLDIFDKIF